MCKGPGDKRELGALEMLTKPVWVKNTEQGRSNWTREVAWPRITLYLIGLVKSMSWSLSV